MYKLARSFDERQRESRTMVHRHRDRLPVVIEPRGMAPEVDKRKYMVPKEMPFGQFMLVVRNRMSLGPEQALFFFTSANVLVSSSTQVGDVYLQSADEDGFLYIFYQVEHTFGGALSPLASRGGLEHANQRLNVVGQ